MAYASLRGRKPMERASKISHADVINNPQVREFLTRCTVPRPAEDRIITELLVDVSPPTDKRIRIVVAVDGGFQEIPIQERFPAATLTFFTFGPLLLH
jgi:hypothetical protein